LPYQNYKRNLSKLGDRTPINLPTSTTLEEQSQMRLHLSIPVTVMGLSLSLLVSGKATAATFSFTEIADTSAFSLISSPSLNDEGTNEQGTVAFEAGLDAGSQGIFIGSDPVTDKVIATGDSLFGSTVTSLKFVSAGLNNRQQIAFFATLDDGTSGIFRADPQPTEPQPVPEPTSVLGLLAFGALGTGSMLKRKQKKQLNSAS
jgi:hypothetical protein